MSSKRDMTSGSLGDKIILYVLPLAATGILQQLFNAADVAVVGQYAGKEAMAAVGSNAPVIGLLVNLFVGISLGSNVVISNLIGREDFKGVKKTVHTSIVVALLGGLLMTLIGQLLVKDVVKVLGVPDDVFDMSVKYLRVYLLGMPVILLYNFESAIFRSCGNTVTPLISLIISGVTNVLLNLLFVIGFHMDVAGVAAATVIANLISSAILFVALTKTKLPVKVDIRSIRIDFKILTRVLKIGVPAGLQGMVFSFANIVVQSATNSLGTTVMAASSAAFNLEIFAYYILNSFGQACTTFVGQNHGAGHGDRCKKTLKLCLIQSFLMTAVICSLILLSGKVLLSIFNGDPEVIDTGYSRLCYIFLAYSFSFALEVLSGYLRGFGVSFIPALCSIIGICGIRLTWIFFIFPNVRTFAAIMQVYPVSLGTTTLVILAVTLIVKPSKRFFKTQVQKDQIQESQA